MPAPAADPAAAAVDPAAAAVDAKIKEQGDKVSHCDFNFRNDPTLGMIAIRDLLILMIY